MISKLLPPEVAHFNPLPPYGGRRDQTGTGFSSVVISIHSLRMEGDIHNITSCAAPRHFNPLPPYGGRHIDCDVQRLLQDFNPLPPYGGRLMS